jgi:hypothetical protein
VKGLLLTMSHRLVELQEGTAPITADSTATYGTHVETMQTPCLCSPLHRACNPELCYLASRFQLPAEDPPPEWALETTLSALRESAAQNECFVCSILFTGLVYDLESAHGTSDFAKLLEGDIFVRAKDRTGHVETGNKLLAVCSDFYASQESSTLIILSLAHMAHFLPSFSALADLGRVDGLLSNS